MNTGIAIGGLLHGQEISNESRSFHVPVKVGPDRGEGDRGYSIITYKWFEVYQEWRLEDYTTSVTDEQEVLNKYSTAGLRKFELDRYAKGDQLNGLKLDREQIKLILDQLYGPELIINAKGECDDASHP